MQLDRSARAASFRLLVRDTVDSTNAEALTCARAGDRGDLWITAQCQTAGRGRRGRAWISEPGNFFATLLLIDPSVPARAAELSFVSALGVYDAVRELAPAVASRLGLKWPNDLLVAGGKIAGVLVEGETLAGAELAVAIGVGINCAHHPPDTAYPATDLAALGVRMTPQQVLRVLSASMLRRLRQWDRGNGFAAIRHDWLLRAEGVGAPIRVRTLDRELEGVFSALDSSGRLILAASDGTTRVVGAGEVFSLSPDLPRVGGAAQ